MKKRNVSKLFCMAVCVSLLTGCGGEYAGITEGDIVSGSAVSGEAVSGDAIREKTVSGPVVKEDKDDGSREGNTDMSSHCFCTDTNLYYVNEDEDQIMQARVDGTHRKCIWGNKKELDMVELLCVDKNWLYYDVTFDYYKKEITYRAPVGKDEKGYDTVRFSESEELVKTGLLTPIYADGDYYFYIHQDTEKFIKYDLKRMKKVSEVMEDGLGGEIFRASDYYFYLYDGELYVQKTDSSQWEKVSDVIVDDHVVAPVVSSGEELLYARYVTNKNDELRFDIRRHDGKQERQFVTWEQLSQAAERVAGAKKMDIFMPDAIFWQEGRLYIQLQTGWMDGDIYHMEYMMFSRGVDDSGLCYEKELTEYMKSHVREQNGKWTDEEENETVYVEHMTVNDAQCIAIVDGKAYLSLYDYGRDKGRLGRYDLKSGKFEWISKEDSAFYLLGFDQNMDYFRPVFGRYNNEFRDEWYWPPSKDKAYEGYFVEG